MDQILIILLNKKFEMNIFFIISLAVSLLANDINYMPMLKGIKKKKIFMNQKD